MIWNYQIKNTFRIEEYKNTFRIEEYKNKMVDKLFASKFNISNTFGKGLIEAASILRIITRIIFWKRFLAFFVLWRGRLEQTAQQLLEPFVSRLFARCNLKRIDKSQINWKLSSTLTTI